jgi:hypothetical protein
VGEARTLTEAWLSQPRAVAPEMVSPVLQVASRFGGRDVHQALVERLDRTADIRVRGWLLDGIASTRVAALLDENVALATSGQLNPREIGKLLIGGKWRGRRPRSIRRWAGPDARRRALWDPTVASARGARPFFAVAGASCGRRAVMRWRCSGRR